MTPILELISEKLSKVGIEPIIAVRERAYGQDIFCTKICGKIIESRFCIVFLDDSVKDGTNIPNPNVYYEYGLMTSLRKHIIPLQKEDMELAFNIQSYDTIKYSPKNIATEIDRAIRDAIKITEAGEPESTELLTDKIILRRFEMAGFEIKGEMWFLSGVIKDTAFKGFGQPEKGFYEYVGKIDNEKDIHTYIDDINIVVHRTEKAAKDLKGKIDGLRRDYDSWKQREMGSIGIMSAISYPSMVASKTRPAENKLLRDIDDFETVQNSMSMIFFVFVANPELDLSAFLKSANELIEGHPRYKIICSQENKICYGDFSVDLELSQY
ncbi:MAG: hypothetical protein ABR985_19895 [Methanotrichaceae archaeon]